MSIGKTIEAMRREAGLGLRELAALIEKLPVAHGTVSAAYLSRLERGADHVDPEKVTIDKLWSIGVALRVDPLALFVTARPELDQRYCLSENRQALFSVLDVPDGVNAGVFINGRRRDLGLSLAAVTKQAEQAPACFGISQGFLSQVETDHRSQSEKLSGEKLWALGVVLSVDPLAMFVLSRGVNRGLHLAERRRGLFTHFSV